jgi:hypothetical protein
MPSEKLGAADHFGLGTDQLTAAGRVPVRNDAPSGWSSGGLMTAWPQRADGRSLARRK